MSTMNLSPKRRRTLAAATAASTGIAAFIMLNSHSAPVHAICGFVAGLSFMINIHSLIRARRAQCV